MKQIPLLAATSVLSACSLMMSSEPSKTEFDFGPLASAVHSDPLDWPLTVKEITAPGWMDNSLMYYRLAYRDAENPLPYRHSAWVMSPAALLTLRLQAQLAPASSGNNRATNGGTTRQYVLRGELVEFEQVFDGPDRSRGVLRLQARLEDGDLSTDRTFTVEEPAPTPDARGGVTALIRCSDEAAREIGDWLSATGRDTRQGAEHRADAP